VQGGVTQHTVGTICDLAKPFKLEYSDTVTEVWVFSFTPASDEGGTVQWDGSWTQGVPGTIHGNPRNYTFGGTEAVPATLRGEQTDRSGWSCCVRSCL
jgi:hypothetical protein